MKIKIKKILISLLSILFNIPVVISKFFFTEQQYITLIMTAVCMTMERNTNFFTSFRLRPKFIEPEKNLILSMNNNIAIVIQGPVMSNFNFTIETIKLYKKNYDGAAIILSTWEGVSQEIIQVLTELKVHLVLNKPPVKPGHLNINYQIISTMGGIRKAKEIGAKYILKTRTDQRIYHANVLTFFISLLDVFPATNKYNPSEKRIICGSMEYGNMFYPYLISDFFFFGIINDIEKLFNMPFSNEERGELPREISRYKVSQKMLAPEIYIMRHYSNLVEGHAAVSVKDYWSFTRNHLICINKDDIGLYWPKYLSRYSEHSRNGHYQFDFNSNKLPTYNFDFIHWLNLYTGKIKYEEKFEEFSKYIV